jgi:hypothetical protein
MVVLTIIEVEVIIIIVGVIPIRLVFCRATTGNNKAAGHRNIPRISGGDAEFAVVGRDKGLVFNVVIKYIIILWLLLNGLCK